jgi:outer membrane protein
MKTRQVLITILAMTLIRAATAADKDQTVTPQQIVSESLAHSYQLKVAGIEPEIMEARNAGATASALPSLKIVGSAQRYSGLVDVSFGDILTIPGIQDRYSIYAELSQTLFTGGRISNSRRAAKFDRLTAEFSLQATDADIRLQTLTAYWNWSKACYSLSAVEAAVKRIEAHNRDVKNQKDAGMATESDALSAQVLLQQTMLKKQDAGRNLELARATTAFLIGHDLAPDAVPQKPDAALMAAIQLEKESAAIQAAMTNRPEKASADMASRSAGAQADVVRSSYYPQLSLVARYEEARPNNLFFPPADEWNDDSFVGAVLTWNLFEGGLTHSKVVEAVAREKQARLRAELISESIALEVKQARIQLDAAIARLGVAESAEKSAERNLEVTRNQWQSGTARNSDVLDAESKYADAQYESVTSAADAALAKARMDYAMGVLGQ